MVIACCETGDKALEANVLSLWQTLTGNLAVVALFVLGWANLRFWLRNLPGAIRAALFGVTMGERGVSQLVSVDLTQAETLVA